MEDAQPPSSMSREEGLDVERFAEKKSGVLLVVAVLQMSEGCKNIKSCSWKNY